MGIMRGPGPDEPVYTIGVVARLLGCSTQTLRIWERESLICPHRTDTNNRLYSDADFRRLAEIQQLTRQGINLAGIRAILGTVDKTQNILESSADPMNDRK